MTPEIELADLGDETEDFVWSNCYPELNALLSTDEVLRHRSGEHRSKVARTIRRAVDREWARLWETLQGGPPAKTELGRELQRRLRTVGSVVDHYVEQVAGEILRRKGGIKAKPN